MEILDKIVSNSGDSILESYSYSNGVLTIGLELAELDKQVEIRIKTDSLSFNNFYSEKIENMLRTCRVEVQNLEDVLTVKNGIYVPSDDFGKLMKETRLNYNLAYGRKAVELKYIFSLVGYDRLVSCLLSNLNCVMIDYLSDGDLHGN